MRSLAPWFIITVGGLFVLFMVLSDSNVSQLATRGANIVGYIDGQEITYQQYSQAIERLRVQQQQATGQEIPETQMSQFRDNVWETMVNQSLIQKKIEEFDITVTDDEIRDALLGPNPPAELRQQFIDSTGQFNRAAYESALRDPQNREIVINVEEGIRQQLYQQKLQAYLNASIMVSESEIRNYFDEQNLKMDADYVYVDSRVVKDSTITVSEDEIKAYYNNNKEDYKTDEQRTVKYVLFRREASTDDTLAIEKNLKAIVKDMEGDTSSFKTFVEIYSDNPFSKDTVNISALSSEAVDALNNSQPGNIVGPVLTPEGYVVYNYTDNLRGSDTYVKASHVLVSITKGLSDDQAKAKADSIYTALKNGADINETAFQISDDPSAKRNKGELGWFGAGQMVKEFNDAAFNGKIGEIQRPVKTQFGYHIIRVEDKTRQQFVIEKIVNKITPSATTVDRLYNNASDFAYLAEKNDFDKEAEILNYSVVESRPFAESATAVSGIGVNKAVVKYAFENSVGDISPVFNVASGYAVISPLQITPAGYTPLEDVKSRIENTLKSQKQLDKSFDIAKEIKSKITDESDYSPAAKVFPRVKISNVKALTPNGTITGVGKDFVFNEYCETGELNKLSDAIKGERGSYLIKITNRTPFDSTAFSIQKNSMREYLLNQKRSTFFSNWIKNLKDEVEIVDNRHKFFR